MFRTFPATAMQPSPNNRTLITNICINTSLVKTVQEFGTYPLQYENPGDSTIHFDAPICRLHFIDGSSIYVNTTVDYFEGLSK